MSREIKCEDCSKPMGEIRDATLRKGIIHICTHCNTARKKLKSRLVALEMLQKTDGYANKDDFFKEDLFGGVFKDIFGNKK